MIHPYMPDVGPLENAMIGSIPIGNAQLPYRYVLVFATIVIGYGYYRLNKFPETRNRDSRHRVAGADSDAPGSRLELGMQACGEHRYRSAIRVVPRHRR